MAILRRYTNLASAIHLLQNKTITLLNPATWDDRNDAYFMAEYKRIKRYKTVLALCFSQVQETYHHWRVFSHGMDGIRIEFSKEGLLSSLGKQNLRHESVNYMTIDDVDDMKSIDPDDLPFMKRWPYRDENEYRVVYWSKLHSLQSKSYPIKLSAIKSLTLSPWMNSALSDAVVDTLRTIEGCETLRISRSTLVENERWKAVTGKCE